MVIGPIVWLKSLPFLYERKASYLKAFSAAGAAHMDPKTKATARDTNWNWKTRFWHIVFVWLLIEQEKFTELLCTLIVYTIT